MDETPLDRIAAALEVIAVSLEKLANPPAQARFDGVYKEVILGNGMVCKGYEFPYLKDDELLRSP